MAVLGHMEKNKKIIQKNYFNIKLKQKKREREREKNRKPYFFDFIFKQNKKIFFQHLKIIFNDNKFLLWQLSATIDVEYLQSKQ